MYIYYGQMRHFKGSCPKLNDTRLIDNLQIWIICWMIIGQLGVDNVKIEMKLIAIGRCDFWVDVN